ncbi:hypothetical protein Q8791_09715 [Nocardiopsis sp. CT-R113]|uniref:Secreted protein n=1 Tax=Nocardiopsis codii TaxID=3065942 RepID=A0ABU7K5J5_9ACTN|nr:hypothetical protein [Nocardiopsis sp. CT-R113]MEE2037495.1 hypothetical protein [Nocardiopsis sp. CT-R113]
MRWWKVLGVAAFVGVAATGVVIARAERQRRAYTPEQVRDRLRERLAEAEAAQGPALADGAAPEPEADPGMPAWRQMLLAALHREPRVDRGPGHEPCGGGSGRN